MRRRLLTAAVAATIVLGGGGALAAAPSQAGSVPDPGPCSGQSIYGWMKESTFKPIQIPSLAHPGSSYSGSALRPDDLAEYPPAHRPVVLIQHGNNGNQCKLWWVARFLAGHGYVALIWTSTAASGDTGDNFLNAVDALRSAAELAESGSRPYPSWSDPGRIGLVGHSLGAIAVSCVQGDVDPAVKAVVGLDNLVASVPEYPAPGAQAPAGAQANCEQSGVAVDPRIPGLGFAHDGPNDPQDPSDYLPDAKLDAFKLWRNSNLPAMELAMRGFAHTDFSSNGSPTQHLEVAYFLRAWLDLWIRQDPSADDRLFDTCAAGQEVEAGLSRQYLSAAYTAGQLPESINTTDYVSWLNDQPPDPDCAGG